ncbi:hypothetical protein B0H19DRAFT_1277056 [Mycena capillaripes]|nr:hypothetical protein B0H19DRAFT_1277056 [Mycena capillaripes]
MSDDTEFANSIAELFLNPARPSPGYLVNPSLSDDRRRELTRHVFENLSNPTNPGLHKTCIAMNQKLHETNAALHEHHDELHRCFDELSTDYQALADEYTALLAAKEHLEAKYCRALQQLRESATAQPSCACSLEGFDSPVKSAKQCFICLPLCYDHYAPRVDSDEDEPSDGNESLGADSDIEKEHLQPINLTASKEDIVVALKNCQLAPGRTLAENRNLGRGRDKGDNRLGYEAYVGAWARTFLLNKEVWVRVDDFRKNRPDLPLDPAARFGNDKIYSTSITSALFDTIPEKYHALLDRAEYRHLAKDFVAELSSARSSMINTLRGVIASILTSAGHTVNSSLLGAAGADRSNAQVLIDLLRFPQDKKFKVFAPILFPKGEKKMEYIFTSDIVLDLHRVMIHGPSSLVENSKPDTKANGTKYGVVEATDHSIALAGTLARFLVSADKTFASIGGITKIPWEADYRTYRKLLASNRNTVFVKHIFKTMNAHVFAGVSKTAKNSGAGEEDGDSDDEVSSAMEHLAFGNFDDPVQSDEDGGPPPGLHTPLQVNVGSAVVPAAGPSRTARFDDQPPQVHEFEQEEEEEAEERPPAPPKRSSNRHKGNKRS